MSWDTDIAELTQDTISDPQKLAEYGCICHPNRYEYTTPVVKGQFLLTVFISGTGSISTKLTDTATGDEYTLYRNPASAGDFIGKIRTECLSVIKDIVHTCYNQASFKNPDTQELIRYAEEQYGGKPEFLWKDYPHDAIIRRNDNTKWYVLLVRLPLKKIGINSDDECEIADFKGIPDQICTIAGSTVIYPAYHMNKKSWYTVRLDTGIPPALLHDLIDRSYNASAGKNK